MELKVAEGEEVMQSKKTGFGCAAASPAPSCYKIITKFPYKKSGYYWQ